MSCEPCRMFGGMDIEFVNDPTWGRLREREPTLGQCLRTLRAWRPEPSETMYTRRVFVLHNMHTSLDFNSVDFLGMLEVLGLQLIFMHRGNWRDFRWSYYCAFATVPLCLDNTVAVWHIDCMMCWFYVYYVVLATAHVFFETHQGECRSTLGMRQGLSSRIEGGFSRSVGEVDVLR